MHVRIQTSGKQSRGRCCCGSSSTYWLYGIDLDKTTAVDAFRKGMVDLTDMCTFIRDTFEAELAKKEYVEFEELA